MFAWNVLGPISRMKLFALVLTAVLVVLALWMWESRVYDNELANDVEQAKESYE